MLTILLPYSFGTHIVRAGAEHIGSIAAFKLYQQFHGVRRSHMLSALQVYRSAAWLPSPLLACDDKTKLYLIKVIENSWFVCVQAGCSAMAVCHRSLSNWSK